MLANGYTHEPACFLAAMFNSHPLGFCGPFQIVLMAAEEQGNIQFMPLGEVRLPANGTSAA
jgi:hypothetical protein